MSNICPCQSQQLYSNCCAIFHLSIEKPKTAEQLMRSRYTAYVMQNISYIIQTTVPTQQSSLDHAALLQWSQETQWDGLEIIQHIAKIDKSHAQVEFKAYFKQQNQRLFHHELSTFVLIDQRWYFLDPTTTNNLTMKQVCLCGSGKKFKQCCAPYL